MSPVNHISFGLRCLAAAIFLLFLKNIAFGQCTVYERVYVASEDDNATALLGATVSNPLGAVGSNTSDYSTLNGGLAGTAIQYLQFASTVSSGTPVTVKLSLPPALVGLNSGVTIQPYINTPSSHTAVGSPITTSSFLSLLGGTGDNEITVTPSGNYDGISVKISGLSVAQTMQIYDAYYLKASTNTSACNIPIDAESGNRPMTSLATIGTVLGQTANPQYAIDNGTNSLNTYAEIDAVATTLSEVYHATIFGSLSQPGDTVKMIVQNSGGGLLDLGVGSGFSIQFYNGNTAVGSPIAGTSSSLSLTLFPDASQKYELDVSPPVSTGQWDRVEVRVGGVASLGLTQGLKIYDVKRVIETPVVNSTTSSTQTVCQGNTTTFTVSNVQACTTYSWYDENGIQVQSDPLNPNYTPPTTLTPGDHQFSVQATRNGCTESTTRTPSKLTVNPLPAIVTTGHPKVCLGGTSTAISYTTTNSAQTYSIAWDATAHGAGFTDVVDAPLPTDGSDIVVNVPTNAPAATYNGILTVKNANGCISSQQPFSIDVDALPSAPVINLTP